MRLICFLIYFSISLMGISQSSKNLQFEKSKGLWPFPLTSFVKYIDDTDRKIGECRIGSRGIIFFPYKIDSVKSVFQGKVIAVFKVGDGFAVTTKFGDYFIAYVNVDSPVVKKGEYIYQGQYIGNITKDLDQLFLEVSYKSNKEFDPYPWFNWSAKVLDDSCCYNPHM